MSETSTRPAVLAHAVSYAYRSPWPWRRDQLALRSVSLEVAAGSVHALVGANGSGKSTLLRILVGQLHAASGTVQVLGRDPKERALRLEVAYLPETGDAETRLSVQEALLLQAALLEVPVARTRERIEARLEDVGMQDFRHRRISALSKGQRRRVALAQALLAEPSLALLDEPFDGVDPVRCEELCDLLRRRAQAGMTIAFSSHSLTEVERAADRMSLFAEGRVVEAGPVDEITGRGGPDPRSLADLLRVQEQGPQG